ncbi:hypothetical protein TBR22_A37750 [Luteitalea sp. TBR-22]|nr:hypothetical protein TBR22_A37750 [Luteitalea sp. TBR-22]
MDVVDLGEPLNHGSQRRATDDGQAGDGGFDTHRVIAVEEGIEQRLGLTGAGGHGGILTPNA